MARWDSAKGEACLFDRLVGRVVSAKAAVDHKQESRVHPKDRRYTLLVNAAANNG